jgi:hypothetical protein
VHMTRTEFVLKGADQERRERHERISAFIIFLEGYYKKNPRVHNIHRACREQRG